MRDGVAAGARSGRAATTAAAGGDEVRVEGDAAGIRQGAQCAGGALGIGSAPWGCADRQGEGGRWRAAGRERRLAERDGSAGKEGPTGRRGRGCPPVLLADLPRTAYRVRCESLERPCRPLAPPHLITSLPQGGSGEAGFEVQKYGDGRVALIGGWCRGGRPQGRRGGCRMGLEGF